LEFSHFPTNKVFVVLVGRGHVSQDPFAKYFNIFPRRRGKLQVKDGPLIKTNISKSI
jgi:hypothetical protein